MLGNAAAEMGQLDAAAEFYRRARELQPNDHVIRYNLGQVHYWRGYIVDAIEELDCARHLMPSYLPAQTAYIMALHNFDGAAPDQIAATVREWGSQFAPKHSHRMKVGPNRPSNGRIRVGFVSGDFRTHSVAHFFEPIASARDSRAFEHIFYSNSSHEDEVTERMKGYADRWRQVWQLSDDALVELISADRIDVLVDLSGHTDLNRLGVFARRPAAVQISYLGYPGSTGLRAMDYRITDSLTDPSPSADGWHTEVLLRLPASQWCFRPFRQRPPDSPKGPRVQGVTFGSFNNLIKLSDTILDCWIKILNRVPEARFRLARVRSARRAEDIISRFVRGGVSRERIECVPYRTEAPHGRQFEGVDIALDSFPYNGVTTTCEALYLGVPVVTLHGSHGVSRSGLSILTTLGAQRLVASRPEQYVDIAVGLARTPGEIDRVRADLKERFERSPLRNERGFAVAFENLLREAIERSLLCRDGSEVGDSA